MAGLRQARKTTQLATQLQQITAGPSARRLPAVVEGLTIRSEGVKGNAGARHFVKSAIPAVRFANPSLRISFEQVPTVKRRKHAGAGAAQKAAEAAPVSEEDEAAAVWKQPPGLTVTFTDPSLPPAFFPLPPQRSERLVSAFWQTFGSEDSLRAWASGKGTTPATTAADAGVAAGGAEGERPVEVVEEVPVKGDGEALVGVPYRLWTVIVGAFPPFLWTFLFKQAKHIPTEIRPPIHINLLPAANRFLLSPIGVILLTLALLPLARLVYYWSEGDKPKAERGRGRWYAASIFLFPAALCATAHLGTLEISNALDLFAFGSYGALHFASPIIAAWWIWGFGTQGAACTFGWTLGAQNLAGLATHLVFPNASPWFYDVYGIDAAQPDYSYPGNPAGLVRVDSILGTHIYTKAFGKGPVVFGAIPSLHAATAICCSLFVVRYSKGYRGLIFMWLYCFWMFWATQYLHHHFAIDLLAGTFYSVVAFTLFERVRLRKLDRKHYSEGLTNGWERLWHARRDGENYDAYGERMLRRLAGGDDGDEPNLVGGIALSPSVSGEGTPARSVSPPAYRDGGYTSLPAVDDKEARECDSSSLEDDDGVVDDRPNGRHDLPTRRTASVV
ncbi:hypothetical protein B0A53_00315 [Rhodotorula sp. CCFEE 5036]|nr:hypothetical protein B0A53_00315 [Rhodotorula sp. CCFEE 5036]